MPRAGTTLLELLVTIAVIAVIATVVVLGFPRPRVAPVDDLPTRVRRARAEAVDSARPVTFTMVVDGRPVDVTAEPDGSVIVDSTARIDHLTGRPVDVVR